MLQVIYHFTHNSNGKPVVSKLNSWVISTCHCMQRGSPKYMFYFIYLYKEVYIPCFPVFGCNPARKKDLSWQNVILCVISKDLCN